MRGRLPRGRRRHAGDARRRGAGCRPPRARRCSGGALGPHRRAGQQRRHVRVRRRRCLGCARPRGVPAHLRRQHGGQLSDGARLRAHLKASRGCIVNVSSIAGMLGIGSSVPYIASKGALNAMTLHLARVLAPRSASMRSARGSSPAAGSCKEWARRRRTSWRRTTSAMRRSSRGHAGRRGRRHRLAGHRSAHHHRRTRAGRRRHAPGRAAGALSSRHGTRTPAAAPRRGHLWPEGSGLALGEAYERALSVRQLRIRRGEQPRGYKVSFTNRTIWERYGVYAPIWGTVWNTTLSFCEGEGELSLAATCQPRIEPECVFGLGRRRPRAPRSTSSSPASTGSRPASRSCSRT